MKHCKVLNFLFLLFLSLSNHLFAQRFSTDGFYQLPSNAGRQVFNFNNGWLYHKGDVKNGQATDISDTDWQQVQLPHGVDILPEDVSGGANYQGVVWYRKYFSLPKGVQNKKLTLTFEAIMGKCDIYLNGEKIQSHKGGYLPVVIDLSAQKNMRKDTENVLAVMADNSDDPDYPPGKPQLGLDFCYYGGIYRDAWLVATNEVHFTHPNLVKEKAGGGVFVSYSRVSDASAQVHIQSHIQNESGQKQNISVSVILKNKEGKIVAKGVKKAVLDPNASQNLIQEFKIIRPELWHPDRPYLYRLHTVIKSAKGETIDGYYQKTGIRMVELKGKEGFYLNGKPFNDKLVGANHHQDFPVVGNAVPNNLSWNDAKKLRDAGIRILRLSHYPQDPAFMDACDELGIFTIVAIPGWQFWNKDHPDFEKLMLEDVRQTIRRDRNHPSVFAWEPIPNETYYPATFAAATYQTTHQEYPYEGCIAVCDYGHPKWEIFDLLYAHPYENAHEKTDKCLFTREWGDNVDNWLSHNSPSRAALQWGEIPQLVQAKHYSNPDYYYTSWNELYNSPKQHIGGALWHAFDNARGYHPDLFYGGILGPYRKPKYSYELFRSQQDPQSPYVKQEEGGAYKLFIANIMSPFSPSDVTVFTNCDSVQLISYKKEKQTLVPDKNLQMPHPPLVFKGAFDFMKIKEIPKPHAWEGEEINPEDTEITAIGFAGGKEVVRTTNRPSKRPTELKLSYDLESIKPEADGSFIIPVFAQLLDENGVVKRLNEMMVQFSIEGEGVLIGENVVGHNPKKIVWGAAPVLVRTTLKPGTIKIHAAPLYAGSQTPKAADLEIVTEAPRIKSVYNENSVNRIKTTQVSKPAVQNQFTISEEEKQKLLKKVEKEQTEFMHVPDKN